MLSQFVFSNYKSFREEALLDFTADAIQEHQESLHHVEEDSETLLPVLCIYGPNGSGKSTALDALCYLREFVLRPIQNTGAYGVTDDAGVQRTIRQDVYHKFCIAGSDTPTAFDILFYTADMQVKYELTVHKGDIVSENLYYRNLSEDEIHIAFERDPDAINLGDIVADLPVDRVKSTMPLLSHFYINYDIKPLLDIVRWFNTIVVLNYSNSRNESQLRIPSVEEGKRQLFQLMQALDTGISDVRIEKHDDGSTKNIFLSHACPDGTICEIPIQDESSGTKKLLSCLSLVLHSLGVGSPVIADELDAKLHPKLLRHIIELFTNPATNKHSAQLLFTSHDMTTMTSQVFRRDEVWFCAKGADNSSQLYSLKSIKKPNGKPPRKDEVYSKQYLEGRYGADPYIQRILHWEDEP